MKNGGGQFKLYKADSINLRMLWSIVSIVLITFLSFYPSLKNSFINWDDNGYVFENPHLKKPLPEAIKYFFEPNYFIGNYIPLTMISYALEYKAANLKPKLYHAVNIIFHLLNVALVFYFTYLLSNKKILVAAFVSIFFGTHPLRVESVTWVSELKDVQYSFFFLLGLITYLFYIEGMRAQSAKKIQKFIILSFVFFVFSTLSKPAAITFPFVLVLLDFYTQRKFDNRLWIEKLPFLLLSVIFGIIAIKSQQANSLLHNDYTLTQKLFFASHSLLNYLLKLILPTNLSIFYPYPQIIKGYLPVSFYAAPFIGLLLFYGIYKTLRYSRLIVFGFLFFLINLILVLQFVSIGDAIMADRYTYIPHIGLLFIIAIGFNQWFTNPNSKFSSYKPLVVTLLFAMVIMFSYLTYNYCKVWKNEDTVATNLLNKFPNDRLALNNKGFILLTQGRYMESIPLFTEAIRLKPDYSMAYINLTNAYMSVNQYEDAMKTLDTAIKYVPNKFNALNKKADLLFMRQNHLEAIKFYKEAISLEKNSVNIYSNIAECYFLMKDYGNSLKFLSDALQLEPDNYMLLNSTGYVLFTQNKLDEALKYFESSLNIKPDYTTASVNLKNCSNAIRSKTVTVK